MMAVWQFLISAGVCHAFFGDIFEQMMGQQQQQQRQQQQQQEQEVNNPVENTYISMDCPKYLCEDTLKCVDTAQDCPCVFPDSQLKCEFPNKQGYVCISKPSNEEGPTCDYVLKSFL